MFSQIVFWFDLLLCFLNVYIDFENCCLNVYIVCFFKKKCVLHVYKVLMTLSQFVLSWQILSQLVCWFWFVCMCYNVFYCYLIFIMCLCVWLSMFILCVCVSQCVYCFDIVFVVYHVLMWFDKFCYVVIWCFFMFIMCCFKCFLMFTKLLCVVLSMFMLCTSSSECLYCCFCIVSEC